MDMMEFLVGFHALKAATVGDDIDKGKIRDALEKIDGLLGVYKVHKYSPTDHRGDASRYFAIIQWKDGDWKWID